MTDIPQWRQIGLTDNEIEWVIKSEVDEIMDEIKAIAIERLDGRSGIAGDCAVIGEIDPDPAVTSDCLRAIHDGSCLLEDLQSGEFSRHESTAKFIVRFNMVDDKGRLTLRGHHYMEMWA